MSTHIEAQEKGIIAKYSEDSFPVVLKLVDEFPDEAVRSKFSWLTVISWKYDGSENNGMPLEEVNSGMIKLEETIEGSIETKGCCRHAYSRTGNNLKEFVYYIESKDEFLEVFNTALDSHPRYPIEINFYEDQQWEDFQRVLGMLKREQ